MRTSGPAGTPGRRTGEIRAPLRTGKERRIACTRRTASARTGSEQGSRHEPEAARAGDRGRQYVPAIEPVEKGVLRPVPHPAVPIRQVSRSAAARRRCPPCTMQSGGAGASFRGTPAATDRAASLRPQVRSLRRIGRTGTPATIVQSGTSFATTDCGGIRTGIWGGNPLFSVVFTGFGEDALPHRSILYVFMICVITKFKMREKLTKPQKRVCEVCPVSM